MAVNAKQTIMIKKYINIWLTYECNFVCSYCYESECASRSYMSMKTAQQTIDFIKKTNTFSTKLFINFHGGEPLLNFKVLKFIVEELKKDDRDASFGLTTNASLLDGESMNFISENCSPGISISIDGTEESHLLNRKSKNGINEFQKILENAQKMSDLSSSLRIRMTINRKTMNKIYENVKFLYERGFKFIAPALDITEKEWTEEDYKIIESEYHKVKLYEESMGIEDGIYWTNGTFRELPKCEVGEAYYNIAPDGFFYPCTFVCGQTELAIGSLEEGFDAEKINEINAISLKDIDQCIGCTAYACCPTTRCKLMNYSVNGDYYKPCESICLNMRVKEVM